MRGERISKTEGYEIERKHNPKLTNNAKMLRKNMTKEERHLGMIFCAHILFVFYGKKL